MQAKASTWSWHCIAKTLAYRPIARQPECAGRKLPDGGCALCHARSRTADPILTSAAAAGGCGGRAGCTTMHGCNASRCGRGHAMAVPTQNVRHRMHRAGSPTSTSRRLRRVVHTHPESCCAHNPGIGTCRPPGHHGGGGNVTIMRRWWIPPLCAAARGPSAGGPEQRHSAPGQLRTVTFAKIPPAALRPRVEGRTGKLSGHRVRRFTRADGQSATAVCRSGLVVNDGERTTGRGGVAGD